MLQDTDNIVPDRDVQNIHETSGGDMFGGRCPFCFSPHGFVEVHGHRQCVTCGHNVDPCCGGAPLA